MAIDIKIGDIARLRKAHPCGSQDWEVTRTGADIGLVCLGCHHRIMLDRRTFERRVKNINPEK